MALAKLLRSLSLSLGPPPWSLERLKSRKKASLSRANMSSSITGAPPTMRRSYRSRALSDAIGCHRVRLMVGRRAEARRRTKGMLQRGWRPRTKSERDSLMSRLLSGNGPIGAGVPFRVVGWKSVGDSELFARELNYAEGRKAHWPEVSGKARHYRSSQANQATFSVTARWSRTEYRNQAGSCDAPGRTTESEFPGRGELEVPIRAGGCRSHSARKSPGPAVRASRDDSGGSRVGVCWLVNVTKAE